MIVNTISKNSATYMYAVELGQGILKNLYNTVSLFYIFKSRKS